AITMGIGTIMEAREVAVLATGMSKAQALSQALTGPVGPACPASTLRDHPAACWIADAEAASLL
ncbi:MAG: 6-phosphogluconolactonase, partial [Maritimibacter sp.]